MIVFEPVGGLCNRMRAIDSAVVLSKELNRALHIIWVRNLDLNCSFDDLFTVPHCFASVREVFTAEERQSLRIQRLLHRRRSKCLLLEQQDVDRRAEVPDGFQDLAPFESVFISTNSRFLLDQRGYREFHPVPSLQEKVDALWANLGAAVGVHIRRTDHQISKAASPTSKFMEAIQAEAAEDPAVRFFLATDDTAEEDTMKSVFPGRIVTQSKRSLDRNRPEGIQDALVDLFCLARCRRILGSHWSSFSETAAELGGAELRIIRA